MKKLLCFLCSNLLAFSFVILVGGNISTAYALGFRLNPIQVCADDGSNCANAAQELFLAYTAKIYAQAGLTVAYNPWAQVNNSDWLSLDTVGGGDVFNSEFAALTNFGDPGNAPGSSGDPDDINVYFVDDLDASSTFYGIGWLNYNNGVAIGWDAVAAFGSEGRVDTIAHEIGHNFDIRHAGHTADFLMASGSIRNVPQDLGDVTPDGNNWDQLSAADIDSILASPFIRADIPEPSSMLLLGTGLLVLVRWSRREQHN